MTYKKYKYLGLVATIITFSFNEIESVAAEKWDVSSFCFALYDGNCSLRAMENVDFCPEQFILTLAAIFIYRDL